MMITKKSLSRRTLLRGAGVALGLPYLDSMTPALAASQVKAPVRAAWFYLPNGVDTLYWPQDAEDGPIGKLQRILAPFEPVKQDILLLSNLTANWGRPLLVGAGDHGGGGLYVGSGGLADGRRRSEAGYLGRSNGGARGGGQDSSALARDWSGRSAASRQLR